MGVQAVTYEQMLMAIYAIAGTFSTRLAMRTPGDWYFSTGLAYRRAGAEGHFVGNGSDPFAAIGDAWAKLKDEVVYKDGKPFKWNDFMWVPQPE